jgi:hypothetical protein
MLLLLVIKTVCLVVIGKQDSVCSIKCLFWFFGVFLELEFELGALCFQGSYSTT